MNALPEIVATIVLGTLTLALTVLYLREAALRQGGK